MPGGIRHTPSSFLWSSTATIRSGLTPFISAGLFHSTRFVASDSSTTTEYLSSDVDRYASRHDRCGSSSTHRRAHTTQRLPLVRLSAERRTDFVAKQEAIKLLAPKKWRPIPEDDGTTANLATIHNRRGGDQLAKLWNPPLKSDGDAAGISSSRAALETRSERNTPSEAYGKNNSLRIRKLRISIPVTAQDASEATHRSYIPTRDQQSERSTTASESTEALPPQAQYNGPCRTQPVEDTSELPQSTYVLRPFSFEEHLEAIEPAGNPHVETPDHSSNTLRDVRYQAAPAKQHAEESTPNPQASGTSEFGEDFSNAHTVAEAQLIPDVMRIKSSDPSHTSLWRGLRIVRREPRPEPRDVNLRITREVLPSAGVERLSIRKHDSLPTSIVRKHESLHRGIVGAFERPTSPTKDTTIDGQQLELRSPARGTLLVHRSEHSRKRVEARRRSNVRSKGGRTTPASDSVGLVSAAYEAEPGPCWSTHEQPADVSSQLKEEVDNDGLAKKRGWKQPSVDEHGSAQGREEVRDRPGPHRHPSLEELEHSGRVPEHLLETLREAQHALKLNEQPTRP